MRWHPRLMPRINKWSGGERNGRERMRSTSAQRLAERVGQDGGNTCPLAYLPHLPAALSALRLHVAFKASLAAPIQALADSLPPTFAHYSRSLRAPSSCNRCIRSGFFFACVRKASLKNGGRCKSTHHAMARQMFSMLNTLCKHPQQACNSQPLASQPHMGPPRMVHRQLNRP